MTEIKTHGHIKYKPEYCVQLIEHMSKGYSFMSFGARVMVGRKTLYNWCAEYPEFAEAKGIAESTALFYFETAIKAKSMDQKIESTGILRQVFDPEKINLETMKWFIRSRFHAEYSEKTNLVVEGGEAPIKVEHKHDLSKFSLEELKMMQALEAKLNGPTE